MHLYEMNYHALLQLVPELKSDLIGELLESGSAPFSDSIHLESNSAYTYHFDTSGSRLSISLIELNPYTQHIQVVNHFKSDKKLLPTLCLNIRVYHDVSLAEVISCSGIGKLLPNYSYPNEKMLLKDEKRQANRLLFEWLSSAKTYYRFKPEKQEIC